ncbi:hypothetical protein EYF80_065533 [Liparis tanakae]|uniref:Uncharacterized protein n=1 Tax=Liparis tanakae TaxID=230148 RepID=A0A4Z2E6S2_9TELE|nr:hypothetical protein EYF80_065533 [Liparis tanakae]
MFFSSSERPAAQLPPGGGGRSRGRGRGAWPVDVPAGRRGDPEDGRLGPRRLAAADRGPDVRLGRGALPRAHGAQLEGRRAAAEPQLQRILPDVPRRRQELPQGTARCGSPVWFSWSFISVDEPKEPGAFLISGSTLRLLSERSSSHLSFHDVREPERRGGRRCFSFP